MSTAGVPIQPLVRAHPTCHRSLFMGTGLLLRMSGTNARFVDDRFRCFAGTYPDRPRGADSTYLAHLDSRNAIARL
jgi:hypothetical protein